MKRFIVALCWALVLPLFVVNVGAAAGKIGVLDVNIVIEQSVAGKEAQAILESFVAERQQLVREKEAERDELELALTDDGAGRSSEETAALQQRVENVTAELTQLVREFEHEIEAAVNDLRDQLLADIVIVTQLFGEENGYDLILDAAQVAFARDAIDVTEQIVRKYDELLAQSRGVPN